MKLLLFIFSLLLLLSCSKDEKTEGIYIMESAPIGKTFETTNLSITFETADSLSFFIKDHTKWNNKARYIFRFGGTVEILNPYGRGVFKEVDDAYFVSFEGRFVKPNILEADMKVFCSENNLHNSMTMLGSYSFFSTEQVK